MAKKEPERASDVRRLSSDVLARVSDYREKLGKTTGVPQDERAVLEAAILLGVDQLEKRAGLARK